MKTITIDEDVEKSKWCMPDEQYNNLHKPNQLYDQFMYNCAIEMIASKYLRGKKVIESFGGIGMSSLRYLKYVKALTINDIDEECIKSAMVNLVKFDNVDYVCGDYLKTFPTMHPEFDFVDFDNFTHLDELTYNNLPMLLKVLNDNPVGFLFTTSYQFVVSRNFQHNFKLIEDKFNIKFKKEAVAKPEWRSEAFCLALGDGLKRQSKHKFRLSEVWLRNNVAKLLMLRKDLVEQFTIHKCYKREDIARLYAQLKHKPLIGGD